MLASLDQSTTYHLEGEVRTVYLAKPNSEREGRIGFYVGVDMVTVSRLGGSICYLLRR